jgi:uncharacterized membrane-anchored protein
MEMAMIYSLISVLLRNGAILFSFSMSVAAGTYLTTAFPMSIWMGIVIVHVTCVIAVALMLLTERVVSRLVTYLRRDGRISSVVPEELGFRGR